MTQWQEDNKGIYSKEKIQKDNKFIDQRKLEWSGALKEEVRDHKKQVNKWTEEGDALTEKIVKDYVETRDKGRPVLLEETVTIVLHKILSSRFLVVRSAELDDYKHGVDNVIIDKNTGNVICAFDEVHGESKHGGEERKEEKIIKSAKRGGTKIDYGMTYEEDENGEKKLVKKAIEHVPTFYLSLEPKELNDVIEDMDTDLKGRISPKEIAMLDKFVESLEHQIEILQKEELSDEIKDSINSFKESLEVIKELKTHSND